MGELRPKSALLSRHRLLLCLKKALFLENFIRNYPTAADPGKHAKTRESGERAKEIAVAVCGDKRNFWNN